MRDLPGPLDVRALGLCDSFPPPADQFERRPLEVRLVALTQFALTL